MSIASRMYHLTDRVAMEKSIVNSKPTSARATAFSPRPENQKWQVFWQQDQSHTAQATEYLVVHTCFWILAGKGQGRARLKKENYSDGIRWVAGFGKEMEIDLRRAAPDNSTSGWCEDNHLGSLPCHGTRDLREKVAENIPPAPSARLHAMIYTITYHGQHSSLEGF
jgi:hypothetical protein